MGRSRRAQPIVAVLAIAVGFLVRPLPVLPGTCKGKQGSRGQKRRSNEDEPLPLGAGVGQLLRLSASVGSAGSSGTTTMGWVMLGLGAGVAGGVC